MRTKLLCVSSVIGAALLGLAGSASAAGTFTTYYNPSDGSSVAVPAYSNMTLSVNCPKPSGYPAALAVGGGFGGGPGLEVFRNQAVTASVKYGSSNKTVAIGWTVGVRNVTGSTLYLRVSVQCLTGARTPSSTYVQVGPSVSYTIPNGGSHDFTSTCGSGIVVGGGFTGDVYSGTDPAVARVYVNGRNSSTAWKVSASNSSGLSKKVTVNAYCLNGWSNASMTQASGTLSVEGIAVATCTAPAQVAGGGYKIPKLDLASDGSPNPAVIGMDKETDTNYAVDMSPGAPDIYPPPPATSWAYGECLTVP